MPPSQALRATAATPAPATPPRPLILLAACGAGHGHLRAAQALAVGFTEHGARADTIDTLDFAHPAFARLYGKGYMRLAGTFPAAWRLLYNSTNRDDPRRTGRLNRAAFRLAQAAHARFFDRLQHEPFDIALSTHFLATELLLAARTRGLFNAPVFQIVTDYDLHAAWLFENLDGCFLATDAIREQWLQRVSGDPHTVHATGIPVHPDFSRLPSKRAARETLHLAPDRFTVLAMTSGFAHRGLPDFIRAFADAHPAGQCIAVAGHDTTLLRRLERLRLPASFRLLRLGFTNDIPLCMAAADVYVGKAGGLSVTEALAARLPMLITHAIPGQEEANVRHLHSLGALAQWPLHSHTLPLLPPPPPSATDAITRFVLSHPIPARNTNAPV